MEYPASVVPVILIIDSQVFVCRWLMPLVCIHEQGCTEMDSFVIEINTYIFLYVLIWFSSFCIRNPCAWHIQISILLPIYHLCVPKKEVHVISID
jgi:hypothetical protein